MVKPCDSEKKPYDVIDKKKTTLVRNKPVMLLPKMPSDII